MLNKLKARGQRHRVDRTFGQKLELGGEIHFEWSEQRKSCKAGQNAPVAQWIEQRFPKPRAQVRFLSGAFHCRIRVSGTHAICGAFAKSLSGFEPETPSVRRGRAGAPRELLARRREQSFSLSNVTCRSDGAVQEQRPLELSVGLGATSLGEELVGCFQPRIGLVEVPHRREDRRSALEVPVEHSPGRLAPHVLRIPRGEHLAEGVGMSTAQLQALVAEGRQRRLQLVKEAERAESGSG